jgi:hypothetical protein
MFHAMIRGIMFCALMAHLKETLKYGEEGEKKLRVEELLVNMGEKI